MKRKFSPNLVAAELPLFLVLYFNWFKGYVLFGCIDPEDNYNNDRLTCFQVSTYFLNVGRVMLIAFANSFDPDQSK